MVTKKIGVIGCGNMGGAILYGALESGVLAKENVYVYDINPAMMEKAKGWGVNLATDDEDVCKNSDIILLAVKPQNAAEALEQCKKALDGKAMMSIVAGVTVERLQAMIDGTPRIQILRRWYLQEHLLFALTMISKKMKWKSPNPSTALSVLLNSFRSISSMQPAH